MKKRRFLRAGEWKGPEWIIGKDIVVVIVRYGDTYVCVYENRNDIYIINRNPLSKITQSK